jgi:hypothetical protein
MKGSEKQRGLSFWNFIAGLGVKISLTVVILLPSNSIADDLQDCMGKSLHTVDPNTTIAGLQSQCEKKIKDGAYLALLRYQPAVGEHDHTVVHLLETENLSLVPLYLR